MRQVDLVSVIVARIAGLVHEDARSSPDERIRHERFLLTRMMAGFTTLACLPPYLVWRGVPSLQEYVALLCLVAPLGAAILLSRRGRLAEAFGISAAALTGVIVCIAAPSGGLASPAVVWLIAPPLEGLLCASRRAAFAAGAISACGVVLIGAVELADFSAVSGEGSLASVMPMLVMSAIAHAAALAFVQSRVEQETRKVSRSRQAEDRSLFESVDSLVTWHDRSGRVLKASATAAKLIGVPAGALHGRGLFTRVHVSDRPAFLQAISDAAEGKGLIVLPLRVHICGHKGGTPGVIWGEMRVMGVEGATEDEPCAIAVLRDISVHRRHAEELEAARQEAERLRKETGESVAKASDAIDSGEGTPETGRPFIDCCVKVAQESPPVRIYAPPRPQVRPRALMVG